jgi:hypothetical protein
MDNNVILEMTKEYSPVNRDAKLKGVMDKWSRTGLLNKLNEDKSSVVAQLLENQAVELRNTILNEESSVGNIAGYNKIAFPLVRRVFGQLLATELVAIQPMSLPSGLLFFLDFTYDRNQAGATAGGSVYGNRTVTNPDTDANGAQDATGGFYNLDALGYTRRNFILNSVTGSPVVAASTLAGVADTKYSDLLGATATGYAFVLENADSTDLSALNQVRLATMGSINLGNTGNTDGTFRGLSPVAKLNSSALFGSIDPALTEYANVSSVDYIVVYTTASDALTGSTSAGLQTTVWGNNTDGNGATDQADNDAWGIVGPAKTNVSVDTGSTQTGDFENTPNIPEINIKVESVPVQAVTRKLKATWTPELAQDINAYHAIDAEVELTTILSDIIATEIDREILSTLLQGATVSAAWSRFPGRYVTAGSSVETLAAPSGTGSSSNFGFTGTNQDWYQTLAETLLTVSNEIHKRNMRSGANWLVTSPDVATIIEAIAYFKPNATFDPSEVQFSMGIEKVGTLSNRFTVYKDPYFPANKILMGYKGPGFLDAGFVYAPYVPLVFTPTIFEPNDFTPRKGAMTRYASKMVRPEFYGTVTVADLNTIGG